MSLPSIGVVPGYTFFRWGFTIPHRHVLEYTRHFFEDGKLVKDIHLHYLGEVYSAKIRIVQLLQKSTQMSSDQIQFFWNRNEETKRVLSEIFPYSYHSTKDKKKPEKREVLEIVHIDGDDFQILPVSRIELEDTRGDIKPGTIDQSITGNNNIQIGGDGVVAKDVSGSMVAGRDINIHNHGVSPEKYAEALAENKLLKKMLGINNPKVMSLEEESAKVLEKTIAGFQYKISIGHKVGNQEYWSTLDIKQIVSHYLENLGIDDFTIMQSEGFWKGEPEKSTVIIIIRKIEDGDIYGGLNEAVLQLKKELQQESILLTKSEILDFDLV